MRLNVPTPARARKRVCGSGPFGTERAPARLSTNSRKTRDLPMQSGMNADGALRSLLRGNPAAIVAAIGSQGTLVPVPASVPLDGHDQFDGRLVMDLIVGEDHVAVIDAWTRAQQEPVVTAEVHLLADPDTPAAIHL